jgi:hypothetical protein
MSLTTCYSQPNRFTETMVSLIVAKVFNQSVDSNDFIAYFDNTYGPYGQFYLSILQGSTASITELTVLNNFIIQLNPKLNGLIKRLYDEAVSRQSEYRYFCLSLDSVNDPEVLAMEYLAEHLTVYGDNITNDYIQRLEEFERVAVKRCACSDILFAQLFSEQVDAYAATLNPAQSACFFELAKLDRFSYVDLDIRYEKIEGCCVHGITLGCCPAGCE